jgi:hypothetical protein
MALILAVEPDSCQASQIAAVLRGRLDAELVIAPASSSALDMLGARVPDVLLTSALLSLQEETTLTGHLRELGAAAAHVQTLTIPILASASPKATTRRGGMLSALRRRGRQSASASTPDGCEPSVFAEQVALYLERAASGRVAVAEPEPVPEPVVVFEPEREPSAIIEAQPEPEPIAIVEPQPEAIPEPEPEAIAAPEPELIAVVEAQPEPEPIAVLEALPETILEPEPEPQLEPALALAPAAPPVEPAPQSVLPWLASMLSLLMRRREPEPAAVVPVQDEVPVIADAMPASAEDDAVWIDVPLEELRKTIRFSPQSEPEPIPEAEEVWELPSLTDIGLAEIVVAAEPVSEPEPMPEAVEPEPPAPVQPPRRKGSRPKRKARKTPVQDEWGFFDPAQCGFAALLDKLDEVTDEGVETRDDTTVRIVSY